MTVGMREANPKILARYLELACDIPADAPLPMDIRSMETMTAEIMSKAKPERLAGIVLPGTFELDGKDSLFQIDDRRASDQGVWCFMWRYWYSSVQKVFVVLIRNCICLSMHKPPTLLVVT